MIERDSVLRLTAAMRGAEGPPWNELREVIKSRGLDPVSCALAALMDVDTSLSRALLLTSDDRIVSILLQAGVRGDIATKKRQARVVDWEDADEIHIDFHEQAIRYAKELLDLE